MKLWKKALFGIAIFSLILFITFVFLIGTNTGLNFLFKNIDRCILGLSIEQIDGNLHNLTLKEIKYEQPGIKVHIGDFHFSTNFKCLLHSLVCIKNTSINNININIDNKKIINLNHEEKIEAISTKLMIYHPSIMLSKLKLHNIRVKVDNTIISLRDLNTDLHWKKHILLISPTYIQSLLINLPTAIKNVNKQNLTSKIQQLHNKLQNISETLKHFVDDPFLSKRYNFRLPFNINLQVFLIENMHIISDYDLSINRLSFEIKSINNHLEFKISEISMPQAKMTAKGEITLAANWPIKFNLQGQLNWHSIKSEKIKIELSGMICNSLRICVNLFGPIYAQLNVLLQPSIPSVPLSFIFNTYSVHWSSNSLIEYKREKLNFLFRRKKINSLMLLQTILKNQELLPINIYMKGEGNLKHFNLDRVHVNLLHGNIDVITYIEYKKEISWHSKLNFTYINNMTHNHNYPIKINGKVLASGVLDKTRWRLNIPQLILKGNINNNIINVNGSLNKDIFNKWELPNIDVVLGHNYLNCRGELSKFIKFDLNINAPQLKDILPELSGLVHTTLKIRGSLHHPQIGINYYATKLHWHQLYINNMILKSNLKVNKQIAGNLRLNINKLQKNKLHLDHLQLNIEGNEQRHQFNIEAQGAPLSGRLVLHGNFNRKNNRWRGIVNTTQFNTVIGKWRVNRPVLVTYEHDNHSVMISPHCWHHLNTQLCVPEYIKIGSDGYLHFVLHEFNLSLINHFFYDKNILSGTINGYARINWISNDDFPRLVLSLKSNEIKIRQNIEENKLPSVLHNINLDLSINNNQLQLDWLIDIMSNSHVKGHIQVIDLKNRCHILGYIQAKKVSLEIFQLLIPYCQNIRGALDANIKIKGNLQQPYIFGKLKLNNLYFNSKFMPFNFVTSNVNLIFNGKSAIFNGHLQTTHGDISLNGISTWNQLDHWYISSLIRGSLVRMTIESTARMDISPYIIVKATPNAINLDGSIDIPWARIILQKVPQSLTQASLDEVILDNHIDNNIKSKNSIIPVNTNVVIHLGKDVHLSLFDLMINANGNLKLVQNNKMGLGLNGQINIPSGHFYAYGQDLIVRKGILHFVGTLDQPYVDLEAIRNPDTTENNVIVGLKVTGIINEPMVEVFSNPEMAQQEAFSYLLRGQGLNSNGDNNTLTTTIIGLGVKKSGQVINKLGEAFGLSNLAIATIGIGNNQQVQVSGYALPDLQIKYSIGIFDSFSTLTLRYRLRPNLYLEAVSSHERAIDLLYRFNF
ncbi:translocation/assembly module TamB domain-containing protein [Pantoea sp. Mhis]|uniref:autotransporter assembly complex protein TamB n=1 Tax=Pantoea sp. Mhis TaxID=2576759 RepID=UPI0013593893|nr:translocation/assembly module TamB domain-containing protein [Pantoea sp. Mhis]MXP56389.1 translocation/assembly module TamB [Pantoea sp. Mhis]